VRDFIPFVITDLPVDNFDGPRWLKQIFVDHGRRQLQVITTKGDRITVDVENGEILSAERPRLRWLITGTVMFLVVVAAALTIRRRRKKRSSQTQLMPRMADDQTGKQD